MNVKHTLLSLLFALLLITPANYLLAGEYSVRPFLIDKTLVPRDVVTETVLLTNEHQHRKYVVYATVNEISVDKEGAIKEFITPSMTDQTVTVTSWIEVSRGRIEIPPGEQREVPLTLHINPKAEPGEYHVFVGFVPASNRPEAEAKALEGDADGVIVKITISDQREDSMRISRFAIDRLVMGDNTREIEVEIQNNGDITSAPTGELIFYNSRGVEVSAVPFNTEATAINPGETVLLKSTVPIDADLGRYKANLSLRYGENQSAALYDTAFFYFMPMQTLLIVLILIIIVSAVLAIWIRRSFGREDFHDGTDEVTMFVRDGHDAEPKDHDIDLKNSSG
ncbi:hypothetical protein KC906_03110 [Candidatus Kaiserbacteria bacterium]|nr:hypothetical protein [Candidatus Kaiserbacteria bacterium]